MASRGGRLVGRRPTTTVVRHVPEPVQASRLETIEYFIHYGPLPLYRTRRVLFLLVADAENVGHFVCIINLEVVFCIFL
jgi:hypothetical protein